MALDEDLRDSRRPQRKDPAPRHRSLEPDTRPNNEPSSQGPGRRTASVQARNQDAASVYSTRPTPSRRVTPRDSDATGREPGIPRHSVYPRRPRHSSSTIRQRQATAAILGRSRVGTMASVRRPSHDGAAHRQGAEASFSLAGPQEMLPVNQPYVHPAYVDLNPEYENPTNVRPVWGLAKPLPRVVRPGMVPTVNELRQNLAESNEPEGSSGSERAQKIADLEDGLESRALKHDTVTEQLETAREIRQSRLLARISSDLLDLGMNSGTPKVMLSPPSEVLEEEEDEEEESDNKNRADDRLLPFPKLDDTPERSGAKVRHLSENESARQTDFAQQIHLAFDDNDATSVREDLKVDPDLIAFELRKIEANVYSEIHNDHTVWSVYRRQYREPLAELLAVIVQLTLGFCADLATTTTSSTESTSWAWGLATMTAVYIAGGISGAHLNPAISIMLYIYRGFPLRKVPIYVAAQILGAFIATFIAYGLYRKNIIAFGGDDLWSGGTAGAIVTFPRYYYTDAITAFFNEFVGTAVLAVAVLALGDDSNAPPGAGMSAFIVGLVVTVLSQAFAMNTGAALNPSRDFGPRLALLAIGYGGRNLFGDPYWVYGPWAATISGAIVGAFIYDVAIFVGGESPVNYPRKNVKRAGKKWRRGWEERWGG